MDSTANQSDPATDATAMRLEWERQAPWHRRWLARIGLQGKLILSFMYMLVLALCASTWLFSSQSSERVSDIMGEQARQISYSLSLASKSAMEARDGAELKRIGMDLLKARNTMFVAFLDPDGKSIALASRDPDFEWESLSTMRHNMQELMQVQHQHSRVLGDYLAVMSPVLNVRPPAPTRISMTVPASSKLFGYVIVGLSQAREQTQLKQINYLVIIVGGFMMLLSLPLSFAIVHRIFLPIRQLVVATKQIAGGDMETQVAIHRPDVIGTLARSFNEMVHKVRSQQEALEDANTRLAEANADLERKVRERTAQLEMANQRLSSEIAEKEDFLRAVSHDLNAPLRNISGMATMLLMKNREKFDEDIIHRLERIQKNVEVETDLIGELLELSRIRTRRQKIETVELDAMVRDLGEVFENDLKSRGISLVIDGRLPAVHCERARLRQVFQNLIDNAIKYMGDGPVKEIHVGCRENSSEIDFYVRDTGIGIDPEDIGKVFFVFRRGRSQAVQNVSGKGVGLASVKSIIETYSGTIWVQSERGQGSTFRFTLNGKYLQNDAGADMEGIENAGESVNPVAA